MRLKVKLVKAASRHNIGTLPQPRRIEDKREKMRRKAIERELRNSELYKGERK